MERKDWLFAFESESLRFENRPFCAKSDAIDRWVLESQASHSMGKIFDVLYELSDGRYVQLTYWYCTQIPTEGPEAPSTVWLSDDPPLGGFITASEAQRFLMGYGIFIPEKLKVAAQAEQDAFRKWKESQPVRSAEHWRGKGFRTYLQGNPAHLVNPVELIDRMTSLAIASVHEVRKLNEPAAKHTALTDLCTLLFLPYPVDVQHWWGDLNSIPPEYVTYAELSWPAGTGRLMRVVCRLADLLDPYSILFDPRMRHSGDDANPNWEETKKVRSDFQAQSPQLESLSIELRKELMAFQMLGKKQQKQDPKSITPPSADALWLYRRLLIKGCTQVQLAQEFTAEVRRPITQGQVSRLLEEATAWIEKGNVLPGLEKAHRRRTRSVDPHVLEQGNRTDGRAPRQRSKRDSERA